MNKYHFIQDAFKTLHIVFIKVILFWVYPNKSRPDKLNVVSVQVIIKLKSANMKYAMLHKKIIVLLVFLLTSHTLFSQIYYSDLTLSYLAQVDAFNYTGFTGTLTIQGSDITDFTHLNSLTTLGGI